MQFCYAPQIRSDFPECATGLLLVHGIHPNAAPDLAPLHRLAASRLSGGSEGDLVEIQAWRRAFARMGLRPTQVRCAAEALLRRFRKDNSLPRIHPLVDLCNAVSLAFAIPIAVFDVAQVDRRIDVRHAQGDETYLSFAGETEHPEPGEVIFVDASSRVHARRWCNRQSATSAIRAGTNSALIVAEAMHERAHSDVETLVAALASEIGAAWRVTPRVTSFTAPTGCFAFDTAAVP